MIKYIGLNSYNECLYDLNGEKIILPNYKKIDISRKLRFDDTKENPGQELDYFIKYNLDTHFFDFNNDFYFLMEAYIDTPKEYKIEGGSYTKLVLYKDKNYFHRELQKNEIEEIKKELENIKQDYIKRLTKYYKKYKNIIFSVGYWVDR